MDMFVYMGIIEELKNKGENVNQYSLRDIKKIYNEYIRK